MIELKLGEKIASYPLSWLLVPLPISHLSPSANEDVATLRLIQLCAHIHYRLVTLWERMVSCFLFCFSWVWIILINIILSRWPCFPEFPNFNFLYSWVIFSIFHWDHIFIIQSSADGLSGCFIPCYNKQISNKYGCTYVFLVRQGVLWVYAQGCMSWSWCSPVFNFLRNLQTFFHNDWINLFSPQQQIRVTHSPHPLNICCQIALWQPVWLAWGRATK